MRKMAICIKIEPDAETTKLAHGCRNLQESSSCRDVAPHKLLAVGTIAPLRHGVDAYVTQHSSMSSLAVD